MPDIAVVIVNYRVAGLTIDCLESLSLELAAHPGMRVIVVDNASGDGSAEAIAKALSQRGWSAWVEFIPSPVNGGFAAGNNIALRRLLHEDGCAKPDLILLLNPDTAVRPGAIAALADFLEIQPAAGLAASRLEDPDGTPQASHFRFPSLLIEFDRHLRAGPVTKLLNRWVAAPPIVDEPMRVDWAAGAALMIRRRVFDDVGLLDERYFMYCEETDFCLQAARRGWECWYVPSSRIIHLVGRSSGVTARGIVPKRRPRYWFDSRRRYNIKNHGLLYAMLADLLAIGGFTVWRLKRALTRAPDADPPHFLLDMVRNSVFVRGSRT
jgi:hypothetical protein